MLMFEVLLFPILTAKGTYAAAANGAKRTSEPAAAALLLVLASHLVS